MSNPKHSNDLVMNTDGIDMNPASKGLAEERLHRQRQLVAAYRLFGKFGFEEGVAGHITVRDPELSDHFWVNPMGVSFKKITISQLLLVNHHGQVVQGQGLLNGAAFTIHSQVHMARPDVVAAAHAHSIYGKSWSTLGRLLDPITQDACAFYNDHALYDEFNGVVLDNQDGQQIGRCLGDKKAIILQNHGLLTVGETVEAAAWWFITMERSCQAQLLAEAAGTPKLIPDAIAQKTHAAVGTAMAGMFQFKPLFDVIAGEQPDMFE